MRWGDRIRLLLALAGLAAGAFAIAIAARAETIHLGTHGAWAVFGGTTSQGRRTCGIASEAPGRRMMVLQHIVPEPYLRVRLARPRWNIPDGVRIEVRTRIGEMRWAATARSLGDEIEWIVTTDTMRLWEAAFRLGSVFEIEFPDSSEPPWLVSLTGSNAAVRALGSCIRALGDMGGATPPDWPGTGQGRRT